jgi:hypothetical protein
LVERIELATLEQVEPDSVMLDWVKLASMAASEQLAWSHPNWKPESLAVDLKQIQRLRKREPNLQHPQRELPDLLLSNSVEMQGQSGFGSTVPTLLNKPLFYS